MDPLPAEVLREIFLHGNVTPSYLLVCRKWCQVAVPILWQRPFMAINPHLWFRTIIANLSDEQRNELDVAHPERQPIFNYPAFMQCLYFAFLELAALTFYGRKNRMNAHRWSCSGIKTHS